jgi:hypothetical protein
MPAPDPDPIEATRLSFTMRGCVSRCTFIAGFTYYELGRNDFQQSYDQGYVVLLTIAFACAVVGVGLGNLVIYYLERARTAAQKIDFVAKVNNTYARHCFIMFLLSTIMYVLGVGRAGYVYFSSTEGPKYGLLVVSFVLLVGLIGGLVFVVRRQMKLQENPMFGGEDLLDAAAVVETTKQKTAEEEEKDFHNVGEEKFYSVMMNQADTIAGRAVYITSFCQSGITRFISNNPEFTSAPMLYLYITSMVVAYIAAFLPAFLLAFESIFLNDTAEKNRTAVAILLKDFHYRMANCYVVAYMAMLVAVAFVGWGCKYEDKSWIPLHCSIIAFVLGTAGYFYIRHTKKTVQHDTQLNAEPSIAEKEANDADEEYCSAVLSLCRTTGSQATISSGFIFYNVVTYGTGIAPSSKSMASDALKMAFLELTAITLAAGFVSAVYDSLLNFGALGLRPGKQMKAFLVRCKFLVNACVWLYHLSMLGFLGNFAICGVVIFPNASAPHVDRSLYVPTITSGLALLLILQGYAISTWWKKRADEDAASAPTPSEAELEQMTADNSRKLAIQSSNTNRALFFGAFAYFALICAGNLKGRSELIDLLYPIFMSFAFTLSVVCVVWSRITAVNSTACTSNQVRHRYLYYSDPLLTGHMVLTLVTAGCFMGAFAICGWEKFISNYYDVCYIMLFGSGVLLVGGVVPLLAKGVLWYRVVMAAAPHSVLNGSQLTSPGEGCSPKWEEDRELQTIAKLRDGVPENGPDGGGAAPTDDPSLAEAGAVSKRHIPQIVQISSQMSFVAGNVFYEILFSEANASMIYNYIYFISASTTFLAGVLVFLTSGVVSYLSELAVAERQKLALAQALKKSKVKIILFVLGQIVTFSWLISLSVFGVVKYQRLSTSWEPSFVMSMISILALLISIVAIRRRSNEAMNR